MTEEIPDQLPGPLPGPTVSFKEVFVLGLFVLLFVYSFQSFYHNWTKNYRDITVLPHYTAAEEEGGRGRRGGAWQLCSPSPLEPRRDSRMSDVVQASLHSLKDFVKFATYL